MIVKTSIGFLNETPDDNLVSDVQGVITGLTGNASFPTPAPPLTTVGAAVDAFTAAMAEAVNGGRALTAIKRAKRAELVSLMRQLASYVTLTSNGDMTALLSSAFPHQKPFRTPVGPLPTPAAPRLRLGALSGQLNASIQPIYGAYTYNWRVALASAPDTFVQTAQTTGGRASFQGLTAGQAYTVAANAIGAAGPTDWSGVSTLMVV